MARADRLQERPYGRRDDQREPVPPDARHGLGQGGDRVVVVHERPVPGTAAGVQAQPVDPLLGRLDQVEPQVLGHRVGEPADLADRLGDAFQEVGVLPDDVLRAVRHARLLVGQERQHDVPRRHVTGALTSHGPWRAPSRRSPSCRSRPGPTGSRPSRRPRTVAPTTRPDPPAPRPGGRAAAAPPGTGRGRGCGRPGWPGGARTRARPSRCRPRPASRRRTPRPPVRPRWCAGSPVLVVSMRSRSRQRPTTSSAAVTSIRLSYQGLVSPARPTGTGAACPSPSPRCRRFGGETTGRNVVDVLTSSTAS